MATNPTNSNGPGSLQLVAVGDLLMPAGYGKDAADAGKGPFAPVADLLASFAGMLGYELPADQAIDSRDTMAAFLGDPRLIDPKPASRGAAAAADPAPFTFTNTGPAPITVSAVSVSGGGSASQFPITGETCTAAPVPAASPLGAGLLSWVRMSALLTVGSNWRSHWTAFSRFSPDGTAAP